MITIRMKVRINPAGKLEFEVPSALPPGDVHITLEIQEASASDEAFTDDELQELLTFTPSSGADVIAEGLTGTWADLEIDDPLEWVMEQRRKQPVLRHLAMTPY
jgi:hypothetical protein